jgi:hypothetical protein
MHCGRMIFDARLRDMPEPQEAMRRRPLPSELTAEEQRMQAARYCEMAATATTLDIQGALLELARQYEEMATAKLPILFPT